MLSRTLFARPTCGLLLAAALGAAPLSAAAQSPDPDGARCALVGPLAVSSYVGLMAQLSQQQREAAAEAATRVTDLIALHDHLGCDGARLAVALDCLTGRALAGEQTPARELARSCIEEAGMPTQ